MARYILLPNTGTHREGIGANAIDYSAGDVVESDRDLIKAFPNKFALEGQAGAPAAPADEDVTAEFDAAGENDVTVLKRKGKWYVCGPEGAGQEISGALLKKDVEDFIYDYIEKLAAQEE